MQKYCFAPITDAQIRILILGSLPGDVSLAQNQYYGHPQNQFWRLMSDITGADLRAIDYPSRLQSLLRSGIGLWDVIATARREGSLDSKIQQQRYNDLNGLIDTLPALRVIAFNGAAAAKNGLKAMGERDRAYQIIALPSSSPAYTLAYAEKLTAWKALKACLAETQSDPREAK